MSILLEALRKSEKSQHPQEVPTIHSDDQSSPVTEQLKIGPLAGLLIVSLFVSGWFIWRQYQAPAGSYQPPVTLTADKRPVVTEPAGGSQAGGAGVSGATASSAAVEKPPTQQRTPVETFKQPAAPATQPKVARPGDSLIQNQANQSASGSLEAATGATTRNKPVAPAPTKREPRQPAPIGYWELPDAIRASVPVIKFSVLVYAKNPDDRFVLINGERLGEGDPLASGPVVAEIRRDGVVFTYRLYRFLVEK